MHVRISNKIKVSFTIKLKKHYRKTDIAWWFEGSIGFSESYYIPSLFVNKCRVTSKIKYPFGAFNCKKTINTYFPD